MIPVIVVPLSMTASIAGPTIEEPSRVLAIGTAIVEQAAAGRHPGVQPLSTIVYPSRMRKPLPASTTVVGSFTAASRGIVQQAKRTVVTAVVDLEKDPVIAFEPSTGPQDVDVSQIYPPCRGR